MEVLNTVSQSYLTQLWSNDVFQKNVAQKHKTITDSISRYFTPILLLIAFPGFWVLDFYRCQYCFQCIYSSAYCCLSLCFGIDGTIYFWKRIAYFRKAEILSKKRFGH